MSDRPVIIGGHSLWVHGWTTQKHLLRELAVGEGDCAPLLSGERHFTRDARTMSILRSVSEPYGDYLLAPPAYALADMVLHRGSGLWWPGYSELDEDEVEDARDFILAAMAAFADRQRPNQVPVGLDELNEQERQELADLFESEIARI